MPRDNRRLRIFIVAGEPSGDQLAGKLIPELRAQSLEGIAFAGVGGTAMAAEGFTSLFPLSDVAVMGPFAIAARLPKIVRRVYESVDQAVAFDPDMLVIIDSPEFTHPIAKRIHARLPHVPIVDYVSPSVWAWRPGRAAKMRRYIDHVLALLPFEPTVHKRLGGPACTYVGHPFIERLERIRALDPGGIARKLKLPAGKPVLVVLPGSRASEVTRLMKPFGDAIALLMEQTAPFEIVIPVVGAVRPLVEKGIDGWPVKPYLVEGEADKFSAFRLARAALAASGTVTLELALSGSPMVVGYKTDWWFAAIAQHFISATSAVLPNLILEERWFPEFIQWDCTPEKLSTALLPLMSDTPERERQLEGIAALAELMSVNADSPSGKAARVILDLVEKSRARER